MAKDRPGQIRRHCLASGEGTHWYGDLVLASQHEAWAELDITPPTERSDDFRPTIVMAKIAATLAKHGPLSQRKILTLVKGNRDTAISALSYLQIDGYDVCLS